MKPARHKFPSGANGFSLVLTLLILSALTIIVVGLFSSTVSEKYSSVSHENVERAEFAVQAGLNRASALLMGLTASDDFLVVEQTTGKDARNQPRTRLLGILPNGYGGWSYLPLFSGYYPPQDTESPSLNLAELQPKPVRGQQLPEDATKTIRVLPWQAQPNLGWEEFYHSDDDPKVGANEQSLSVRYAFWIEDLQGRLNLQTAGNSNSAPPSAGIHARSGISNQHAPAYVPGFNLLHPEQPLLNESALYTLINPLIEADSKDLQLDNWIIDYRKSLVTPEIWKEVALKNGLNPQSLVRNQYGTFPEDEVYGQAANLLEANTATGVYGYRELAKIAAHGKGFAGAGNLKLNLNKVLADIKTGAITSEQGVDAIAYHIRDHLPKFEERAGGYPFPLNGTAEQKKLSYLKALAASIIDYADDDPNPTMLEGQYRGMDSFPLVSEYFVKLEVQELTNLRVRWSITTYAELWNMTSQTIAGNVQGGFDFYNVVKIAQDEYIPSAPSTVANAGYAYMVEPKPQEENGEFWYAPVEDEVEIAPNQYKVVKLGEVQFDYALSLGADAIAPSQIEIAEDHYQNRYRLKFKPRDKTEYRLVDQPAATLQTPAVNLSLEPSPSTPELEPQPIAWQSVNIAAAYGPENSRFENIGDPRAAIYLGTETPETLPYMLASEYQGEASPGGRNRRHLVFNEETTDPEQGAEMTPNQVSAETRPSLWPDGGHESAAGLEVTQIETLPDQVPSAPPEAHPMFIQLISNSGRYYSVTELGNIFDPHMWTPAGYDGKLSTLHLLRDLPEGGETLADSRYCGGNTLRIGRPEHRRWRPDYRIASAVNRPKNRGQSATALLDIFHAGIPNSDQAEDITGNEIEISPGHININTATRDVLRSVLAGKIVMDANTIPGAVLPPRDSAQADKLADTIISGRPYISPAEAAEKAQLTSGKNASDSPLLGELQYYTSIDGKALGTENKGINDPGLEEFFARLYNSSTVRSRNFRIYVTAQVLRHPPDRSPVIEATRARMYHVFIKPLRDPQGKIIRQKVQITYARNL